MCRRPNTYEYCALYQAAKDEAFSSPGEEYSAAFYYLSRINWLGLMDAQRIAQEASERVLFVRTNERKCEGKLDAAHVQDL